MFFFTGGLSICQPFVHEPPLISLAFYKGNCFWNGSQDIPIGPNNCSPPPHFVSFHFFLIIPFIFVPSFWIFFVQQGLIKTHFPEKNRRIEPLRGKLIWPRPNVGRVEAKPTFLAGVEEGTPGNDLMRFWRESLGNPLGFFEKKKKDTEKHTKNLTYGNWEI